MIFIEFLEIIITFLIFIVFAFQIIIPIWNGTLLFPSFRSKARKLDQELKQVRSDIEISEETKKLEELKKRTEYYSKECSNVAKPQKPPLENFDKSEKPVKKPRKPRGDI